MDAAFIPPADSRRFLAGEARQRAGTVTLFFLGGALYAVLEVMGVGLVFPLLAVIMRPESIHEISGIAWLVSRFGLTSQRELTVFLIVAIAGTMIFKNGYMVYFNHWQARVAAEWKSSISRRMMRLYLMSDFRMHMEKSPSIMIRNLSFAALVFDMYMMPLLAIMTYATVAVGISILLALSLPVQTLFGVGMLALGGGALYFGLRNRFTAIGEENNEIYRLRSIVLQQSIGAIRESKILGREGYFLDKFGQIERRSFERAGHYNFLASLPGLSLETVIIVAMLLIVGHVVFIAGGGPQALATVGLLAAAMFRLLPMSIRIVANLQLMNLGKPSLDQLSTEIAECEPRVRVPDVKDDEKLGAWRELQLRDVGFTYPDGTRALHGVTVTIRRNEFVGITGPSGSGKSTLLLLLLGLTVPTEGTISVDGQPFSDPATVRRWQNGIGYVPQGLFIVEGSLADNVAFGAEHPDEERVRRSLEAAQLGEYVASQKLGIHEPVGEYGDRLSGGQKQRVVIARALYRDPDVIAFDEATSTLDAVAEQALTSHLLGFKSSKGLFAIAHRLSTIQHCDKIMYLEKGQLQGFAGFEELKEKNANFRKLAALANL